MSASSLYMAEPPYGQIRHTTKPPNIHKDLIAVGVPTTVLAFIAVSLRFFTRSHVTKNGIHVDDYMVMSAMILSFVLLGCNFPHMDVGLGYHMWEVTIEDFESPFQKWTLVGTILYATSLAFTKVSILLFYLRLSPHIWFRILVWILVAVVVVYATVYDLISVFGCKPIAASWDLSLAATAVCMDQLTKYMALSVLNIVIDILTLVLPIPVIARLLMPRRQKISVCAIFATGSFVCAVAVRRTALLQPLMASTDYTWDAVEQFQWCFVEVNAAIVCACAPALKPFFARYIPSLLSSRFRSDNYDEELSRCTIPGTSAVAVDQNTGTNRPAKYVYEMQWRDDVSEETSMTKRSAYDDEARLWKGNKTDKNNSPDRARAKQKSSVETQVRSVSVSPALGAAPAVSDNPRHDTPNGIHVTSETMITYGPSRED